MEQELISKGKCLFCEGVFLQDEIRKHLAIHLMKMTKEDAGKSPVNYRHIEVEAHDFFLHLLVRGDTSRYLLDKPLPII